jgi:hypothetical protein
MPAGRFRANQPQPGCGLREMGPQSSKQDQQPVEGAGLGRLLDAQHPLLLLLVERTLDHFQVRVC